MIRLAFDRYHPDCAPGPRSRSGPKTSQPLAVRADRRWAIERRVWIGEVRQPLRLARAVAPHPIYAGSRRIGCVENDAACVRSPHWRIVASSQRGQPLRRIALQIAHPDIRVALAIVERKRQTSAVGRKTRLSVQSRSGLERLRMTGAIEPKERAFQLPLIGQIDESSVWREAEFSGQIGPAADVFDDRLRRSDDGEALE